MTAKKYTGTNPGHYIITVKVYDANSVPLNTQSRDT